MLGPEFASCWLKIGRAEKHTATLKDEIGKWSDSKACAMSRKCESEGRRYSMVLHIAIPPDSDRWSLIAAECVQNLRSALDHFIYAVAIHQTGMNPPVDAKLLQFPICDTPDSFSSHSQLRRIGSLSPSMQAGIEGVQPYNRPHHQIPPLLGILRDLNDFDKHRLLKVALARQYEGAFYNIRCPCRAGTHEFSFDYFGGDIVDGTEVASVTVHPPCLDVIFEHKTGFTVGLDHRIGPSGVGWSPMWDLMSLLCRDVRDVVERLGRLIV